MAHTLGAVYDTPHGVACAMMLPIVMEYNADCTGERYREIARAMGVQGVDSMSQAEYRKAAVDAVRKLSEDVGIPSKLEALKEEDLPFLDVYKRQEFSNMPAGAGRGALGRPHRRLGRA